MHNRTRYLYRLRRESLLSFAILHVQQPQNFLGYCSTIIAPDLEAQMHPQPEIAPNAPDPPHVLKRRNSTEESMRTPEPNKSGSENNCAQNATAHNAPCDSSCNSPRGPNGTPCQTSGEHPGEDAGQTSGDSSGKTPSETTDETIDGIPTKDTELSAEDTESYAGNTGLSAEDTELSAEDTEFSAGNTGLAAEGTELFAEDTGGSSGGESGVLEYCLMKIPVLWFFLVTCKIGALCFAAFFVGLWNRSWGACKVGARWLCVCYTNVLWILWEICVLYDVAKNWLHREHPAIGRFVLSWSVHPRGGYKAPAEHILPLHAPPQEPPPRPPDRLTEAASAGLFAVFKNIGFGRVTGEFSLFCILFRTGLVALLVFGIPGLLAHLLGNPFSAIIKKFYYLSATLIIVILIRHLLAYMPHQRSPESWYTFLHWLLDLLLSLVIVGVGVAITILSIGEVSQK